MRVLLLADQTINKTLLGQVQLQVGELYRKNTPFEIEWMIEEFDYSDYPIEEYGGFVGYWGIQQSWLRERCAAVYNRHREGIDQVVFLIDSTNWRLTGVWGWNISKQFSGYGVQQVRFANNPKHTDARNVNNTVGTLYHELMHDHDSFVYTYLGITIEPLVSVRNWDNDIVHGQSPDWAYIRYNENQAALKAIGTLLYQAMKKRRELYTHHTSLQKTVIQLLQQKLMLLRRLLAEQRGDIAILPDNRCTV